MRIEEKLLKQIKQVRFDYILIWGHGLRLQHEIIAEIRNADQLEIVDILKHKPTSIEDLVNEVYSHDYAPIEHLKGKLEYLLKGNIPPEVIFVFIKNSDAQEAYLGEDKFRHVESLRIKVLKEKIRDKFNPRQNGKRSEHHVIHASDNQIQTDYILKYLGYAKGIEQFQHRSNLILNSPYHLSSIKEFTIKRVSIADLRCKIVKSESPLRFKILPIEKTPHYKNLTGEAAFYKWYIYKFFGRLLRDNHYVEKFDNLNSSMKYLDKAHPRSYIICKFETEDEKYYILDGVHRAAILKFKGEESAVVAVVK
jgi:hypothetical protein